MYQVIESINVLEDKTLQKQLMVASGAIFVVGAVASIVWLIVSGAYVGRLGDLGLYLMAIGAISVAILPVHELVHGLFFKLLGPKGIKLTFGYKDGMLFCGSPDAIMNRHAMLATLLAPAVLITVFFAILGAIFALPICAFTCIWAHLSGCVGDFLMSQQILKHPEATFCRDTNLGIDLLRWAPNQAQEEDPANALGKA